MIGFQLKRVLKSGAKSLWMHKLRSGLTMLGITFGVCSVIAMLAIGTGASQAAQEQIQRLGSHNIIIDSVKPPASQQTSQSTTNVLAYGLTYNDYELISSTVPYVQLTVPARKVRDTLIHESSRMDTETVGTTPEYIKVTNMTILQGRFLTQADMDQDSMVCVLGKAAADVLFPLGDEIGGVVRNGTMRFRVVGVATSMARGDIGGQTSPADDPNTEIYIPYSTMKDTFGATNISRTSGSMSAERVELHEIIAQVDSLDAVRPVESVIRHILKASHAKDDYQVIVPLQLLVQAKRTQMLWSFVLSSIAAISLLVGGIGIMNITLATVMERTREIGIRRAMGAKRRHIIFQFLTETLILALCGGVLGVALGFGFAYAVQYFAKMATIVTVWSVALSFGISAAVGLGFGIYPAYRAANLDPIEALRRE
jgi:putative ABC transport system permease protein